MSLDLNEASKATFDGSIVGIVFETREENLGDRAEKFRANMKATYFPKWLDQSNSEDVEEYKTGLMERPGLTFEVKVGEEQFKEWIYLPGLRGYQQSNLKKIVEGNSLKMVALPEHVGDWTGEAIKCSLNSDNYYQITK